MRRALFHEGFTPTGTAIARILSSIALLIGRRARAADPSAYECVRQLGGRAGRRSVIAII
jgi:hypothetical protein